MALSTEGLSDAIYEQLKETFKPGKAARPDLRKFTDALAEAVVTYFKANAEVAVNVTTTTTVTTSDAGLQRDPVTPFTATLAPTANKTLGGTGTGTGTIS
jgi:hypothetical protein